MAQSGHCLCGAVKIRVTLSPEKMGACHCTQCQRWTGGGPLYAVPVSEIEIEGEDATRSYAASDWGERVFCGTCGTTLWWKMQGKPVQMIAPGLLEDQSALKLTSEIFVDTRPGWMPVFHGATQSTEAEEMAKLAEALEGDTP